MPTGRPPKPTKLKLLEGNPGQRRLNYQEPQPRVGLPRCPGWLAEEAKREWRRVVPELYRLGLLTLIDATALAAYCQSYARWYEAERVITEHGQTYEVKREAKDGTVYVHGVASRPEVGHSQRERQIMKQFLTEFGLTPSSRVRLVVPGGVSDPDSIAGLLT